MAQLHAGISSVYSVFLATSYSTPSPVVLHGFAQACKWQMDSGLPGGSLCPCLIHEQGVGAMPLVTHHVRNTLSPVHRCLLPHSPFKPLPTH